MQRLGPAYQPYQPLVHPVSKGLAFTLGSAQIHPLTVPTAQAQFTSCV